MRYAILFLMILTSTAQAQSADPPDPRLPDSSVGTVGIDTVDSELDTVRGLLFVSAGMSGTGDLVPYIGVGGVLSLMPTQRHGVGVYADYQMGGTMETGVQHTLNVHFGYTYRSWGNETYVFAGVGDMSLWLPDTDQISATGIVGQVLAVWEIVAWENNNGFSLGGRLFAGTLWDLHPEDPDLDAEAFVVFGGGVVGAFNF